MTDQLEAEREHARAQFIDFGSDTCDTCRRAQLRDSFRLMEDRAYREDYA